MTDIPILFSKPMVLALLAGRKTMTRRLALRWKEPPKSNRGTRASRDGGWVFSPWRSVKPGDRLWVRETWSHDAENLETCKRAHEDILQGGNVFGPYYRATEVSPETLSWISPIHMPRWASRLTLAITATKVERLQEISKPDAIAEGVQHRWLKSAACAPCSLYFVPLDGEKEHSGTSAKAAFEMLWIALHGPDAWEANPEVVALTFTVHKHNIDTLKAAA
jgi:hypothetical protein